MTAPFTPEQEARLHEIVSGAIEMAVAAGAGHTPSLLLSLDFMRIGNPSLAQLERPDLLSLAKESIADMHATQGMVFPSEEELWR